MAAWSSVQERKVRMSSPVGEIHGLYHALYGCGCDMATIRNCVICERRLRPGRSRVDTCSRNCEKREINLQHVRDNYFENAAALLIRKAEAETVVERRNGYLNAAKALRDVPRIEEKEEEA